VNQIAGVLLVGFGAAGLVWCLRAFTRPSDSDIPPRSSALYRPSDRRREGLVEAAGLVLGGENGFVQLARQQMVGATVLGVLGVVVFVGSPSTATAFAVVVIVALGWKGPVILARGREERRRQALDIELVDTMGELVMGVEVGLSLDVAMARYADHVQTPLASEFRHYLNLVQLGWQRADAMDELVRRNPTPIVRLFVSAVVQNQRLGTPLAGILRQQAATARRQRRQAVEEKATKIPIKMIFPTVFCILPVLVIVIIGPSIVVLLEGLS
jgi:tight adherence protein C